MKNLSKFNGMVPWQSPSGFSPAPQGRQVRLPLPDSPYLPGYSTREHRLRALAFIDTYLAQNTPRQTAPRKRRLPHPAWRLGVHLFRYGFFWEAHETWERLWRQCPAGAKEYEFLRVLLQYSASALHCRCGRFPAAQRVAHRAAERLEALRKTAGNRNVMGIDTAKLARALEKYIQDLARCASIAPVNTPRLPLVRARRSS